MINACISKKKKKEKKKEKKKKTYPLGLESTVSKI